MADTATKQNTAASRPTKPDEELYKSELAKAEKALEASKNRLNAVKSKLDLVQTNNKDSPQGQKQAALRQEQAEIRKKHQTHKDSRTKNQDQVKRLDDKLKSLINEQKNARSKVPFKSVEEIDREIDRLKKQVDTGTMKLVDERKALTDISALHRTRKGFESFAQQQKNIDDIKAQIADLKKSGDNPEVKALNDRYDDIQAQLNEMKKGTDDAFKNLNSLRDERTKAHNEQQESWKKVREIQDNYHQARRAYRDHENQARNARREKAIAEKQAWESGKRREVAQAKLEEASVPAYQEEIITAENLIRHFDPSSAAAKEAAGPGKFAAVAQRKVDDSAFAGARVVSKKKDDDEDYMAGTSKKKKSKGAKPQDAPAAASNKFNLSVDIITSLAKIGIDPPVSQSHVPIVITKLKEKIDFWKGDQDRKTKENVAKAKKEIEKLEQEASPSLPANVGTGSKDTSSKPAAANQGVNGKVDADAALRQEQEAVADATAELEKAKIEDAA